LGSKYALQGNLEPARVYSKEAIYEGVTNLADIFRGHNGWIFNLGHGMQPDMNPDNAKYLVDLVRQKSRS
jgi:uroporphyrinogen decarboxylase